VIGLCLQVPAPSHSSTVQGLLSSLQPVPGARKPFVGQLVPLHCSGTSHSPAAGRHCPVMAG